MQYRTKLNLNHEIKIQNNDSQKIVENRKVNTGVIFIGKCDDSKYEIKKERTYWFHKYLQDLQNRGISQKIRKHF
ncbi:MAG: hypothetical protein ACXABO_14975 [Promethearchaeota archaeon]